MATTTEGGEERELREAARLKALAESKFTTSNNPKSALKYAKRAQRLSPKLDGITETVTSLNILSAPDWYTVLGVDPFATTTAIRKQYNNLSSLLHPDNNNNNNKNPHVAPSSSSEALKLVEEAFRVLSDRSRRKDYDANRTFWTACSTCRLLHQFERRYVGHNLLCPGCNKSFKAVEAVHNGDGDGDGSFGEEETTLGDFVSRRKKKMGVKGKVGSEKGGSLKGNGEVGSGGGRLRMRTVGEVLERSKPKRVRTEEETMTLAEFQSEVKRKVQQEKKMKEKEEEGRTEKRGLNRSVRPATKEKQHEGSVKRKGLRVEMNRDSGGGELEAMAVVDSDFYDFDKDRVERSFRKGQVWAVYDDDDGMPRNYALIDETVSANPFEVMISWLDLKNSGDGKMVSTREKLGFHIPCGRFKVARKASISSVNIFSHVVDCDRAAREVYKIYPKKGSVWALYSESTLDADEGKRNYDIVVFLTSYSEMNGLSMAYLEKVDGYKTVFKRQEMGSHAIRFLGKDDIWLISHQIPARKFPCNEAPELLKDCWELDPASLPSDLLTTGGIDN